MSTDILNANSTIEAPASDPLDEALAAGGVAVEAPTIDETLEVEAVAEADPLDDALASGNVPFDAPGSEEVDADEVGSNGKPKIHYGYNHKSTNVPGRLNAVIKQVEQALFGSVYVYAGVLSQLVPTPASFNDARANRGRRRAVGSLIVSPLDPDALTVLVASETDGRKWNERDKKWKYCVPDRAVIKGLFGNVKDRVLPQLAGLTSCPVFVPDKEGRGFRVTEAGYNPDVGLYCDFEPEAFPVKEIEKRLTADGIKAARDLILDALREFAFSDDASKAVAVSTLLTPFVRPLIENAPLVAVTAPTAGTGKTMLATLVSIVATGRADATVISYTEDEAEFSKRIFATLLESSPVIIVDNIPDGTNFRNPSFESILTSPTYQGRILGLSKMAKVSTSTCWLATGNNLRISGDVIRRTVLCALDRHEERPQDHPYERNLKTWALEHRAELVMAALTVLAGYVRAGKPKPGGYVPLASFEEWSDLIRGATCWILTEDSEGFEDKPCRFDPQASQDRIYAEDPTKLATTAVFESWYSLYGAKPMTAAELVGEKSFPEGKERAALTEALTLALNSVREPTPVSVSRWLHRNRDRIVSGYTLKCCGLNQGHTRWKVTKVASLKA